MRFQMGRFVCRDHFEKSLVSSNCGLITTSPALFFCFRFSFIFWYASAVWGNWLSFQPSPGRYVQGQARGPVPTGDWGVGRTDH